MAVPVPDVPCVPRGRKERCWAIVGIGRWALAFFSAWIYFNWSIGVSNLGLGGQSEVARRAVM